jgi:hypothetical protein
MSGWPNMPDASDAKKSIGVGGSVGVKKKISQVDARVPQTCVVVGLTLDAPQPPLFYTLKRVDDLEHVGQRKDLKTMDKTTEMGPQMRDTGCPRGRLGESGCRLKTTIEQETRICRQAWQH